MAGENPTSPKIKKILGKWKSASCVYYLVKWEDGYPDTWERTEDVHKQQYLVDEFKSIIQQRNLQAQTTKRGGFLAEAKQSTVKHGLTTAMLKYVMPNTPVKKKAIATNQNTNNNARKPSQKSKDSANSKSKKNKKEVKNISVKSKGTKNTVKVVSKAKNVKSASAKVTAARTKAVKVLTKTKSPSLKERVITSKINAKIKSNKKDNVKLNRNSQGKFVKSKSSPQTKKVVKTEKTLVKSKDAPKAKVTKTNSSKENSPVRKKSVIAKSETNKTKENKVAAKRALSPERNARSTNKPVPSKSSKTNIKSENLKNINEKICKTQQQSNDPKKTKQSSGAKQTSSPKRLNTKSLKQDEVLKKNSDGNGNSDIRTGIINKSRKRAAENSQNSKSSSPSGEPRAKRQLLDKSANTSPRKGISGVNVKVDLTDADTDTDSETLYSLGTSVLNKKLGGAKKELKLNICDIRSVASSECTTPESERETSLFKIGQKEDVCLICGDKPYSSRYGALACDACSKFFYRTTVLKTQFKPCGKQCNITPDNRKDCPMCRWKRCIQAGMSSNYVNSPLKYSPRTLKPTLLPITPTSMGNSPYKTPPRTPDGSGTPPRSDMLDSIPDIPVMPMLPNSPAASHRNLMKRMKTLEADRGIKRSENGEVERRTSVRQSESVFKYKEIVVKKCPGFTQILLFTTSTKMKNALNADVFIELRSALENARKDDSKLVMLSGQGSIFCSGIDLAAIAKGQQDKLVNLVKEFTSLMISYPKPVVAVVNGPAIGFGAAFLPLCDIVYASDKASFHCPYSRLCQTPEACSSFTFPQVMGSPMANEMLLAGRKLTALEAHQAGLVSQVFWPTSMMQEVVPRLQQMAQSSAKSLEASKLLIRSHQKSKLEFTNETECQILNERWRSAPTIKAIESYLREEQDFMVL